MPRIWWPVCGKWLADHRPELAMLVSAVGASSGALSLHVQQEPFRLGRVAVVRSRFIIECQSGYVIIN
jgi:hypothetical protein